MGSETTLIKQCGFNLPEFPKNKNRELVSK